MASPQKRAAVKTGGSKLSLQKRNRGDNRQAVQQIVPVQAVDLNETCQFTGPMRNNRSDTVASYHGNIKVKQEETELEPFPCQFCGRDITHMNSTRRQQHINRCLDKYEETEREKNRQKQDLEKAKTAVLDCPMCGKHFKSEQSRTAHLKKCASHLSVSTEVMLKLVKDQEAERQQLLAAGIVPQAVRSSKTSVASGPSRKRKVKASDCDCDEDMQVAMAISTSLAEQEKQKNPDLIVYLGMNKKAKKTEKDSRKTKRKKVVEETPLLISLSEAEKGQRLAEKVNSVLTPETPGSTEETSEVPVSRLHCAVASNPGLWERNVGTGDDTKELFYVKALVPPVEVSHLETGSKLRRMSSIPGRDVSMLQASLKIPASTDSNGQTPPHDSMTASTQTAVVLAELAVDSETETSMLTCRTQVPADLSPTEASGIDGRRRGSEMEMNSSGFCVKTLSLEKKDQATVTQRLLKDLSRLIDDPRYSDVNVVSSDGQTVGCHKAILTARCPVLLQCLEGNKIPLKVSGSAVYTVVTYLYTGEITCTATTLQELRQLSGQLELTELGQMLQELENQEHVPEDVRNTGDGGDSIEEAPEIINSCSLKEVWGESDSDESEDGDMDSCHRDNRRNSGTVKGDHFDLLCTQKQQLCQSNKPGLISSQETSGSDGEALQFLTEDSEEETGKISGRTRPGEESCVRDRSSDTCTSPVIPSQKRKRVQQGLETKPPDSDASLLESRTSQSSAVELTPSETYQGLAGTKGREHFEKNDSSVKIASSQIKTEPVEIAPKSPVDESKLDTSSADLFCSPSPIKQEDTHDTSVSKWSPCDNSTLHCNDSLTTGSTKDSTVEDNKDSIHFINDKSIALDKSCVQQTGRTVNKDHQLSVRNTDRSSKHSPTGSGTRPVHAAGSECEVRVPVDAVYSDTSSSEVKDEEEDDDDLVITGDNFAQLSQTTASPTFTDRKHKTLTLRKKMSFSDIEVSPGSDVRSFRQKERISQKSSARRSKTNEADVKVEIVNKDDTRLLEDCTDAGNSHCPNNTRFPSQEIKKERGICEVITEYNEGTRKTRSWESTDVDIDIKEEPADIEIDVDEQLAVESYYQERSKTPEEMEVDQQLEAVLERSRLVQSTEGMDDNTGSDGPDVWDGFDDCGAGFQDELPSPVISPVDRELPTRKIHDISAQSKQGLSSDDSLHSSDSDGGHLDSAIVEDAGLLDDGEDSFLCQHDVKVEVEDLQAVGDGTDNREPARKKGNSFKTPTTSTSKSHGALKTWAPPSPFTPMPDYDKMRTPVLKREVQKFGVRPVGKKRMLKMLKDIYEQTHQYETDSEVEDKMPLPVSKDGSQSSSQEEDIPSSQDSDISVLMEESVLHMSEEDSDVSTSPQKSVDLKKKVTGFIKLNRDIHNQVLMYEPLEIDIFKGQLKDAGIKCGMDKLLDILDEMGITFTMKNTRNSHRGKGRKKKTTKTDGQKK